MVRLNEQGLTDREIARAIERETGLRFTGRWVRRQRHLRQIAPAWRHWEAREKR
jgi:hypothetical protein